jgi:hypothetical protein
VTGLARAGNAALQWQARSAIQAVGDLVQDNRPQVGPGGHKAIRHTGDPRLECASWARRSKRGASAARPDRCDTQGMPTEIYFAGENVRVTVDEAPSQVAEAFTSAQGLPFRLTARGGRGEVYVNPSTVAFWLLSEHPAQPGDPSVPADRSEPPREAAQPTKQRQAVTNIWGQPLRRKRRH